MSRRPDGLSTFDRWLLRVLAVVIVPGGLAFFWIILQWKARTFA